MNSDALHTSVSIGDLPPRYFGLFDLYTFRTRLQPALLALLPLAVGLYALVGGKPSWGSALWGLFGMAGGLFFLAAVARQLGRAVEPALWQSWGGAPTTQLLRHRGPANPLLRARWHRALAEVTDLPVPTAEDERADPATADLAYEAATKVAIARTRDARSNTLLFKEDVAYGYSRNLYALRRHGAFFALAGTAVAVAAGVLASQAGQALLLPSFCAATNFAVLLAWLFYVNDKLVRVAAFAYAERLLEAIDAPARTPRPNT